MRILSLAVLAILVPAFAHAQQTLSPIVSSSPGIPVKLDLYDGDKYSHKFSDGIRAALASDTRFDVMDKIPPEGLEIEMNDSISSDPNNSSEMASYKLTLKNGKGKYIANTEGYCNVRKFDMCGRVAVEDSYNLYQAYAAKQGN